MGLVFRIQSEREPSRTKVTLRAAAAAVTARRLYLGGRVRWENFIVRFVYHLESDILANLFIDVRAPTFQSTSYFFKS